METGSKLCAIGALNSWSFICAHSLPLSGFFMTYPLKVCPWPQQGVQAHGYFVYRCHAYCLLKSWLLQVGISWGSCMFYKLGSYVEVRVFSVHLCLQGYTLADEEEDPLIYQHRMLRSSQGDALASGPVETGPMKKLHVSTINLQKAGPLFPGGLGSRALFFFSYSKPSSLSTLNVHQLAISLRTSASWT